MNGESFRDYPAQVGIGEDLKMETTELSGWTEDITAVRCFSDLPKACQDYVRFLEKEMGARIERISVGPGRDQIFVGESGQEDLWRRQ